MPLADAQNKAAILAKSLDRDPIFKALDHHPLHELPGLEDCDTASLSHWVLREARKVLPQVDRVDLYETRGSGAIALLGHEGPALPI